MFFVISIILNLEIRFKVSFRDSIGSKLYKDRRDCGEIKNCFGIGVNSISFCDGFFYP
jgi:hypothetical protein